MILETFFEKFELFADAPNAVAKMRQLVLDLALNGSVLSLDTTKWNRVSLGSLGEWGSGGTPLRSEPQFYGGSIPWLVIGDLNDGVVTAAASTITEEGLANSSARLLPKGVLLIAMYGSIGKMGITGFECATNQAIAFCKPDPKRTDLRYLFHTLKGIQPALLARGQGLAQKNISQTILKAWEINLPPLAEQKRIVAKVDELMALCDQLEVQQKERDTQHSQLARASLDRFTQAPSVESLNFIFHKSYDIKPADLRKSILTLAVKGKLVPQDPSDEPAEELLARLEQERTHIAKKHGVRPPKNVPPPTIDKHPHDIPESWQWSRIGHLAIVIDYGTSQKADGDSSNVPVYRMGNIVSGRLVNENLKYVNASIDDLPGLYLKTDDILFNRTNSFELVGKTGIYKGPDDVATFASYLIRIRMPGALLFPPYFSVAMNAPYYRLTQIEPEVVQQCGQANFNGTKLAATVVPLPPLAEQRRIVSKVEQLMGLVDELEAQLTSTRASAAKLLDAIVAELSL